MAIQSKVPSKEYMENYDKIFSEHKKKKEQADQQSDAEPTWSDRTDLVQEEGE